MFNDNDLKELEIKVRQGMNENRFRHTLGVMYTAAALAMKHGAKQSGDFITRTMVAGLYMIMPSLLRIRSFWNFVMKKIFL